MNTPRVSREQAELLKKVGYDVPSMGIYPIESGEILFKPARKWNSTTNMYITAHTLHEAADWERSNGVHVWTMQNRDNKWYWMLESVPRTLGITDIADGIFDTHDSAYEASIVHGLKYIK